MALKPETAQNIGEFAGTALTILGEDKVSETLAEITKLMRQDPNTVQKLLSPELMQAISKMRTDLEKVPANASNMKKLSAVASHITVLLKILQ
ncbi:hypothetical protein [Siphonobacter aquaeclarae]|uniref:Uncharacterized protein n=1 Tax=Siphonobacter aquaeclarae TaxID=563176 RepID=A0A1G9T9X2_9BACT|nr:hypothetical protein [Siphonobacter aquaeclarae]SDM44412.1 hypothetical protein SAMN04488090_3473 [Siphonobacter aquaeclarae]